MAGPRVELLWWSGCPSTQRALGELREMLHEVGLDDVEVQMTEIQGDDEALAAGFSGSPTIRVDGDEVSPAGDEEPFGLTCRVYRRRDGAIAPTPDPQDVREALIGARERAGWR